MTFLSYKLTGDAGYKRQESYNNSIRILHKDNIVTTHRLRSNLSHFTLPEISNPRAETRSCDVNNLRRMPAKTSASRDCDHKLRQLRWWGSNKSTITCHFAGSSVLRVAINPFHCLTYRQLSWVEVQKRQLKTKNALGSKVTSRYIYLICC